MSRRFGRSELAAEYYDKILFEGATFADLLDKIPGADFPQQSRRECLASS